MKHPTQHHNFMQEALLEAQKAFALGEVPIGAVVVVEDRIIAKGHNLVETSKDATAHAEILALRAAAKTLDGWRLTNASLYVTMEPCTMCLGAIVLARVKNLYFGCYDKRYGAVGSLYNLTDSLSELSQLEVFPELLEKECREIVQLFFSQRRSS